VEKTTAAVLFYYGLRTSVNLTMAIIEVITSKHSFIFSVMNNFITPPPPTRYPFSSYSCGPREFSVLPETSTFSHV
jgi:hypothetical protein